MDREKNRINRNTVFLFFGFFILFVLSFSLGVIVGKGLSRQEFKTAKEAFREGYREEVVEMVKTPAPEIFSPLKEEEEVSLKEEKPEEEAQESVDTGLSPDTIPSLVGESDSGEKTGERVSTASSFDGRYTVQIGAFKSREQAQKLVDVLKEKGHPAFLKQVYIPDMGSIYRVRVGGFKTREEAKTYSDNLKRKESVVKSAFVTLND